MTTKEEGEEECCEKADRLVFFPPSDEERQFFLSVFKMLESFDLTISRE